MLDKKVMRRGAYTMKLSNRKLLRDCYRQAQIKEWACRRSRMSAAASVPRKMIVRDRVYVQKCKKFLENIISNWLRSCNQISSVKLTLHVVSNRGRRTRSLTMMTVNKFIEIFMNSDFMYCTHLYHAILEGELVKKIL